MEILDEDTEVHADSEPLVGTGEEAAKLRKLLYEIDSALVKSSLTKTKKPK